MDVRTARPADASAVAELLDAFNREFDTPTPGVDVLTRRFEALLDSPLVAVVLAADLSGLGVVTYRPALWTEGWVALLEELYVQPDRRDAGVGTALLERVVDAARARGCTELQINVDGEDHDARRFYERHGLSNREPGAEDAMYFYYRDL